MKYCYLEAARFMATEQHPVCADRSLLALPTSWPARRDYRRAQRLARTLGLEDCQAVFLDTTPRSAARYRWGLFYPLACVPFIAAILVIFGLTSTAIIPWLADLLLLLFLVLVSYACLAPTLIAFQPTLLHCEQIHFYANGFVAIDRRGRRQGARWDQLFDFRRGAHEEDQPSGRVRWNIIRSAIANPRLGQRHTLKIMPQLPDSTEICARIERAYTSFWLPRFREQFAAGETLDFDALLLQRDCLGKTTPGSRRFSASLPRSITPPNKKISVAPGMARGLITQTGREMPVEWLRRSEVKSIRIDGRLILIRTVEPVRRDKQGRADRVWFQLDTLSLKDAAILKELLPAFPTRETV
jgi:hypothetical protein